MKSNDFLRTYRSPTYSGTLLPNNEATYEVYLPITEETHIEPKVPQRRRTKRKTKIPVKDIVFSDTAHNISQFYRFTGRKSANYWSSYPDSNTEFRFNRTYGDKPIRTLVLDTDTVVVVHPLLKITNLTPYEIYVPKAEGSEVQFIKAIVSRNQTEFWNVQVQFEYTAKNPAFEKVRLLNFQSARQNYQDLPTTQNQYPIRQPLTQVSNTSSPVNNYFHPYSAISQPPSFIRNALTAPLGTTPALYNHYNQPRTVLPLSVMQTHTHGVNQSVGLESTAPVAEVVQTPVPVACPSKPVQMQNSYKKGLVVICKNCGIASRNLHICDRCGKSVQGRKVIKDPTVPLSPNSAKKMINEEIVELSSDDDGIEAVSTSHVTKKLKTGENGVDKLNEKLSPEGVVDLLANIANRSDGMETFVMISCKIIRIGSYAVEPRPGVDLTVTFSEAGIYFQIPSCSNIIQSIGIPKHQMLNIKSYFSEKMSFVAIATGPKFAVYIRNVLDLGKSNSEPNYFCPLYGDDFQKELVLIFKDYEPQDSVSLQHIYRESLLVIKRKEEVTKLIERYKIRPTPSASASLPSEKDETLVLVPPKPNPIISNRIITRSATAPPAQPYPPPEQPPPDVEVKHQKLFHYPFTTIQNDGAPKYDSSKVFMESKPISINDEDIVSIGPGRYLNDQVVDFWMRHIVEQLKLDEEGREKIYVFNTFFYTRLTTKNRVAKGQKKSVTPWEFDSSLSYAQKRHMRVERWTRKVDIFEKDFLFIPINDGNSHWLLGVICYPGLAGFKDVLKRRKPVNGNKCQSGPESTENVDPRDNESLKNLNEQDERMETETDESEGPAASTSEESVSSPPPTGQPRTPKISIKEPCILVFDSLGTEPHAKTISTLREYLVCEYIKRKGSLGDKVFDKYRIPGFIAKVPQQPNLFDCGIYLLQYMESFFKKPIERYAYRKALNLQEWFTEEEALNKREVIYNFVKDYVQQHFPDNVHLVPELTFST